MDQSSRPLPEAIDQFRQFLLVLARSQLGPRMQAKLDASDIVQQTLLDAHGQFGQFRGSSDAELAAWLRQMLAHNLADAYRAFGRQKRDISRERTIADELDQWNSRFEGFVATRLTSPSMGAAKNEQLRDLARAMGDLPDAQRLAIELHHLQGESLVTTARTLDRSEAAVAGLLRRGLAQLRTRLA